MNTQTAEERFVEALAECFDRADAMALIEWIQLHCRLPASTETPGPFDLTVAPHVEEPIIQIDSPETQEILMDWATRNCKTYTSIFILIGWIAQYSAPCGAASASLGLRDNLIGDKLYPALEACVATSHQIPPEHLQRSDEVKVGDTVVETAISNSPATLASFAAQLVLINEAGLWKSNSIQRMRQRMKNFGRSYKMIIEGKAEDIATCTITQLINEPDVQRRVRQCQCPHCDTYQPLEWGWGDRGAGLKWEKLDGKHNAAHAMATVYYECVNGCKIKDGLERDQMIRSGRWVPEGQTVDKLGRLRGKPKVPSVRRVAFTKLSSLYSLLIDSWAQVVGEFFDCKDDLERLREFITGTLGIPYDPKPANRQPERIAQVLHCETPYGIAPIWSKFPTVAVDVGHDPREDELEFFWSVAAWGGPSKKPRGHWCLEGHFEHGREAEFIEWITTLEIPHEDGGVLIPRGTCIGIDSGDGEVSEKVCLLCEVITERFRQLGTRAECLPLKGDSGRSNRLNWFTWGDQGSTKREIKRNQQKDRGNLIMVNSERTQSWREASIAGLIKPDHRDFLSIPLEYYEDWQSHEDMLAELAADFQDEKGRWLKGGKNERGDLYRYHRSIASVRTFKDTTWHKLSRNPLDKKKRVAKAATDPERALVQSFVGEDDAQTVQQILRGLLSDN